MWRRIDQKKALMELLSWGRSEEKDCILFSGNFKVEESINVSIKNSSCFDLKYYPNDILIFEWKLPLFEELFGHVKDDVDIDAIFKKGYKTKKSVYQPDELADHMLEYYEILHGIVDYFNHGYARDWISEFIPEKYPENRLKHLKKQTKNGAVVCSISLNDELDRLWDQGKLGKFDCQLINNKLTFQWALPAYIRPCSCEQIRCCQQWWETLHHLMC